MEDSLKDDGLVLSLQYSQSANNHREPKFQKFTPESQNHSISIPLRHCNSILNERRTLTEASGNVNWEIYSHFQQNQGASRRESLEKFPSVNGGSVEIDSYSTTCPRYDHTKNEANKSKFSHVLTQLHKVHKGLVTKSSSCLHIPGVISPHAKAVQQWNRVFVSACLVAVFVDPLFFFLLSAIKELKCIVIEPANSPITIAIVIFRSLTDFIYLLHILLQFRLAYVAPESRVVGAGEVVEHPKKIALNYLRGYLVIDIFNVMPVPQVSIILFMLPKFFGSSGAQANTEKNILRVSILLQNLPRLCRFLTLLARQTPSGFIFESAWENFIINLLIFMLSAHVVGSCWYLFGLQRVNQCLRDACHSSNIESCMRFIDCGNGNSVDVFLDPTWSSWINDTSSSACFQKDGGFNYGIYAEAVGLIAINDSVFIQKYVYSLFWGFQQISTLAGNLTPSYFVWEVLFTMAIVGLGLLLFALLIGNMQNFLQALGQRRLEMSLRQRDYDRWMSHRCLPEELRRQVRSAERYNWVASRGVNEEKLLENLPEELQRDIRRHLFKFVKKVRIFSIMDDQLIDAICERLKLKIFIEESKILYPGGAIEKIIFIIRGKVESIEDKTIVSLSEGDVCGEELLTWCLEHYSVNKNGRKVKISGQRVLSNRTVRCLTNVEAFVLQVSDLEEVTSLYARFLRNQRVLGAIRYESPYWRAFAAKCIQVTWRYHRRRRTRYAGTCSYPPQSNHSLINS
ncbi:probable cyclic nucleotide-gated ion channel 20, chloroplastic [Abrus precatorius]|uniref:Probable cyclic nucleotide-gated ion channel 20, chloroplastic n=1 Tax=Abrus precatorius TaxID=3816 RepID=A0A8B8KWC3_ABRPR|nr:probable cyclic nucleotide-gated ion channel 20, chloroplastic [Abrus precatorius]